MLRLVTSEYYVIRGCVSRMVRWHMPANLYTKMRLATGNRCFIRKSWDSLNERRYYWGGNFFAKSNVVVVACCWLAGCRLTSLLSRHILYCYSVSSVRYMCIVHILWDGLHEGLEIRSFFFLQSWEVDGWVRQTVKLFLNDFNFW